MPLYEYYCEQCRKKFEAMEAMKDKGKMKCPNCYNEVRPVFSRFNFSVKI